MRIRAKRSEFVGRSTSVITEFKQIFSNNKRKVLYEITGNLKFEGEDL